VERPRAFDLHRAGSRAGLFPSAGAQSCAPRSHSIVVEFGRPSAWTNSAATGCLYRATGQERMPLIDVTGFSEDTHLISWV